MLHQIIQESTLGSPKLKILMNTHYIQMENTEIYDHAKNRIENRV